MPHRRKLFQGLGAIRPEKKAKVDIRGGGGRD